MCCNFFLQIFGVVFISVISVVNNFTEFKTTPTGGKVAGMYSKRSSRCLPTPKV